MANPQARAAAVAGSGQATAAQSRARFQDRLSRTTLSLESARAMQDAARSASAASRFVPEGLRPGGLEPHRVGHPDFRWDGVAAPVQVGQTVNIRQQRQQAVLHWKTFNIGRNTTLNFDQSAAGGNAAQWVAVNRVFDPAGRPSQILGRITAQGQVYVVNQNGVIFGGSSQVNTRALVASSLPINPNLLERGVLNNPDLQFLFSALPVPAGSKGTPAFDPPPPAGGGSLGPVVVEAGARISTPLSADNTGGRVALLGPRVIQEGEISTPDGQTILAAGLQVGWVAGTDPSLRGVETFVGAVSDPVLAPDGGLVRQRGLLRAERGAVTLAGRDLRQEGVIASTTSVSLNGRVDLIASYDAVANSRYDPAVPASGRPFLHRSTGSVLLAPESSISILPEWDSLRTIAGSERLALPSRVNIEGLEVRFAAGAGLLAPAGEVRIRAGNWSFVPSPAQSVFLRDAGRIQLDAGSFVDVSGTRDVQIPMSRNFLDVELRGAELADSPLQRQGVLRGPTLTVDLRRTGVYGGRAWVGTPLADLRGYLGLVERGVGELTLAGGSIDLAAGGSVALLSGSALDVSGGWRNVEGGMVRTTRLLAGRQIIDIAEATPDRLYSGLYDGRTTVTSAKWGVSETYRHPFAADLPRFEPGYLEGAAGGKLAITAPSMLLAGTMHGQTVTGPRQLRASISTSEPPPHSSLSLLLQAERGPAPAIIASYPDLIRVVFGPGSVLDRGGRAAGFGSWLPGGEWREELRLDPQLLEESGFGNLTVRNEGGSLEVPRETTLQAPAAGSITLAAGNLLVEGVVRAPAGRLNLTAYNITPEQAALAAAAPVPVVPAPAPGRGLFALGPEAVLSVAGLVEDDRPTFGSIVPQPFAPAGGLISIQAHRAVLASGSVVDASGGLSIGPRGFRHHGDGGGISISAGQDPGLPAVLGGGLALDGRLLGHSGARGASLALQAPLVQIGGQALAADSLVLEPGFFTQGGFASYRLTGLGSAGTTPGSFLPGIYIAPGTTIAPVAAGWTYAPRQTGAAENGFRVVQKPVGVRPAVDLAFSAPGVRDPFSGGVLVRGDIVMEAGASMATDPLGSVSFSANTVTLHGTVSAPGGQITVSGGTDSKSLFPDHTRAMATVHLGPSSVLSTAGTTLLLPDSFGRRTGLVLPGGSISVRGNILAEPGSRLDVSGTSGVLDLHPAVARAREVVDLPAGSGLTTLPFSRQTVPVQIDSEGGRLTLQGGQMLLSEATLLGRSGGPRAAGGTLVVSSGRFYPDGASPLPNDLNLFVKAEGPVLGPPPAGGFGVGRPAPPAAAWPDAGAGLFSAATFTRGGFDSLSLRGNVRFLGPVDLTAGRSLSVADGGVLQADAEVRLTAPYVALGMPFAAPVAPENRPSPFLLGSEPFNFAPTHGPGRLVVSAQHVDLGTLSLQGIGRASIAATADLRGSGFFNIAGDLDLRAGQIYPVSASDFTLVAYDHRVGGSRREGRITVEGTGTVPALPLSAGGRLGLHASVIRQGGVLRAPFGSIQLGWDGTGSRPVDLLAGAAAAFPTTRQLTLAAGSVTSVSAVEPLSGRGILVPYGVIADGTAWIDPRGVDITSGGLPGKEIRLAAAALLAGAGSTLDLRGGGDLLAYRWEPGNGGSTDLLASEGRFAVLPGYESGLAPFAPFAPSLAATEGPGYANATLAPGDSVVLAGSRNLPAGSYTLLPARYALLPGAVLVTPLKSTAAAGTLETAEGASIVSGHLFNRLQPGSPVAAPAQRFEVAAAAVVNKRSRYDVRRAGSFLSEAGGEAASAQRLPRDAGYLLLQAGESLSLLSHVASAPGEGGRGAALDLSTPKDLVINASGRPVAGAISLDARKLSSLGMESLLLGGQRSASGQVEVRSGRITLDNLGTVLSAPDVTLVARSGLTMRAGSSLASSGPPGGASTTFRLTGDGTALRVSHDEGASLLRSGTTPSVEPRLLIERGAGIRGPAMIADSSARMEIEEGADLLASAYTLKSGRITLRLAGADPAPADAGLLLEGSLLQQFQQGRRLSLAGYSSIDLIGSGLIGGGGLASLTLDTPEIRGRGVPGAVTFRAGGILLANLTGGVGVDGALPATGTLAFESRSLRLGAGQIGVRGFELVRLESDGAVVGEGRGGLRVSGDLTLDTPLLTGAAGADRTLQAGGRLNLTSSGEPGVAGRPGLGSALALHGGSIHLAGSIVLPSGLLSAHAHEGDLILDGRIDVGGTRTEFFDVTRYTDGGRIELEALRGSVRLNPGGIVDVSSEPGGGAAGSLVVRAPQGGFFAAGTLVGAGVSRQGAFALDTSILPSYAGLGAQLTTGRFLESQVLRVRGGDVVLDGPAQARLFRLSADAGSVLVQSLVDASGRHGGTISLAAHGDVTLAAGALLKASGEDFNAAGQGGVVELEAGASAEGSVGPGMVRLLAGSTIDLSVASLVPGDAFTAGSSARAGRFAGKLHLRAPQNPAGDGLAVAPLAGEVRGASAILVEGYRLYDLTSSGGLITGWRSAASALPAEGTVQRRVYDDAAAFLDAGRHERIVADLLAGGGAGWQGALVLVPGAEILNRTGGLTLGSAAANSTALGSAGQTSADWDLADFRFGPQRAPGVLTLRAAGDLTILNALSDGFRSDPAGTPDGLAVPPGTPAGQQLWLSPLMAANPDLPLNLQSWSFRLSAGADLAAADFRQVLGLADLAGDSGSLLLGKLYPPLLLTGGSAGANGTTAAAINNRYQVIRTGTGDISIQAARDVLLRNQFASIYTAGVRVPDPTLSGTFDTPQLRPPQQQVLALGPLQQAYPALFSMAGGDLGIRAGRDLRRVTQIGGQLVDDSVRQLPSNWLYRRGFVDPVTGEFGRARNPEVGDVASTAWWVDFSNFFFDTGTLGGGDLSLEAGRDIRNVNAALPTSGRMPKGAPEASRLLELGGGDLQVRAGRDLDGGLYLVQRGTGSLSAGRDIITNPTRSPSLGNLTASASLAAETWLPTTLFLGRGGFEVQARGDILLGPVANPHLLPAGYNNTVWYKTYFSTYAPESFVHLASLGGSVTLRTSASLPASGNLLEPTPLLLAWAERQLLGFSQNSRASFYQPWLRLAERATDPFRGVLSLLPPVLRITAHAGAIQLAGDLTLTPSAQGAAELLAAGGILGLQPSGLVSLQGTGSTMAWSTSRLNISDANPAAVPGTATPFGYQTLAGFSAGQAVNTANDFLKFVDDLFRESGATVDLSLQTKQALHGPGPLHAQAASPVRLYARAGDISGLALFAPKFSRILASRDISDVALYLQNVRSGDLSVVAAGRDLLPYNAASPLRVAANAPGNIPLAARGPLAGDLQIGGPGDLQVLAGRQLDLGTGPDNGDGTGTGVVSIGNARNPYLPFGGAGLLVAAGLGPVAGLGSSSLDFDGFIDRYVRGPDGARLIAGLGLPTAGRDFEALNPDERRQAALQVFFRLLREAGRSGDYGEGLAAISSLFAGGPYRGDLLTRGRNIRTRSGGDIAILVPGGSLRLADGLLGTPVTPPGIITETGGNISIFARGDIDIGVGRSFTLRGGNQILWSSTGDIAAGSSAKTVQSAPPTRVLIDPTSAAVQTDLAGLATGGGIGVLATVAGIEPGDVDLIAPAGTVDAGDAGIRVSGNLSIAADRILNADNIQVSGVSAGVPASAPVVSAPAPVAAAVAPAASSATSSAAQQLAQQSAPDARDEASEPPSLITVEVLGYGGGEGSREEDEEAPGEDRQAAL